MSTSKKEEKERYTENGWQGENLTIGDRKSSLLLGARNGIRKNDRFVVEIKSGEDFGKARRISLPSCVGSMNGERGKISRQRESNAKFRPIVENPITGEICWRNGSRAIRTSPVYHAVEVFERRSPRLEAAVWENLVN